MNAKSRALNKAGARPYVEGFKTHKVKDVSMDDISTDEIHQYRLQTRTGDLKESLTREGQREPIDLAGRKPYTIVDGYRRVAAIRALGWKSVKALVHKRMSADEAQRLAFLKNVVRKNLTPLDKANAICQAKRRGRSVGELARDFGISTKQVGRYEELLELPDDLKRRLDAGEITMAHAKVLLDFQVSDVAKWVAVIDESNLPASQLLRLVKKQSPKRAPMGRRRQYAKLDPENVRVYAFAMSRETPQVERDRAAKLLEEAALAIRNLR